MRRPTRPLQRLTQRSRVGGHVEEIRVTHQGQTTAAASIAAALAVVTVLALAGCSHHEHKSAPPPTVRPPRSSTQNTTTTEASAQANSVPKVILDAARSFVVAYLSGPGDESSAAFAARLRPYVTTDFERRLETTQRGFQDPNAHGVDVLRYSGNNKTVTIIADRWPLGPNTGMAVGASETFTVTVTLASLPDGTWRADQVEAVPTS